MFAVIQKDVCIFGSGKTSKDAVLDAREWMNKDCEEQKWTAEDYPCNSSCNSNQMMLVPCTKDLYDLIQKVGGDAPFVIDRGLAQTWEEFEGGV